MIAMRTTLVVASLLLLTALPATALAAAAPASATCLACFEPCSEGGSQLYVDGHPVGACNERAQAATPLPRIPQIIGSEPCGPDGRGTQLMVLGKPFGACAY
jgi:hypothetical protein